MSVLANVGADPESGGEELNEAELAMFLIQLLVAGNETTRNLISGGLVALAENPDQWAALQADRSLIPAAVEELLRWTTPVISFMRTATADTTIRGVDVAAGDPVLLSTPRRTGTKRSSDPTPASSGSTATPTPT